MRSGDRCTRFGGAYRGQHWKTDPLLMQPPTVNAFREFLGDLVVCSVALGWCWLGLWISLLGFSVYHSRGDVWLPTPPEASAFFLGMVLTGTLGFALIFLLISSTILHLRARPKVSGRSERGHAVSGNAYRLGVKYFAFLTSAFVSPYFYDFMWRFHGSHSFRIAGGLIATLLLFVVILIAGESFSALAMKKEQRAITP